MPTRLALATLAAVLCAPLAHAGFEGTPEYKDRFPKVQARPASVDRGRLAPYRIILVPGLATDLTERVGKLTGELGLTPKDGFLAPFFQQRNWMRRSGIPFEMAPINREGGCDEDGDIVA